VRLLLLSVFLAMLAQGETGQVEIVVRHALTGETLPGVPVTLTLKPFGEPNGPSSTVVTDPRGVAVFSGLANGTYAPSVTEPYRAAYTLGFLVLDPGERPRIDVRVQRLSTISVRVLDPDAKPVKDAVVRLAYIGYVDGRRELMTGLQLIRDTESKPRSASRKFRDVHQFRVREIGVRP